MTRLTSLFVAALLLAQAAYAAEISPDGLLLHYSFDEVKEGVATDAAGKGNHGKIVGAARRVNTAMGAALRLDGKSAYIDAGTHFDSLIDNAATLMVWCRAVTPQGGLINWSTGGSSLEERLVLAVKTYYGGAPVSYYVSDGKEFFSASVDALPAKEWTHFALTLDGESLCLYRDGALVHTVTQSARPDIKDVPLWIGRCTGLGKAYFHGLLDEVLIYNRALSQVEVLDYYKQEARSRGKDMTRHERPRVHAAAYSAPGKIAVTLNAQPMHPLPEGARFQVDLRRVGAPEPLQQRETQHVPPTHDDGVVFDASALAPGAYSVRARVVGPDGNRIHKEATASVAWPGRAEAFKGVKVLNNLVWEVLSVEDRSVRGAANKEEFPLPFDRWVYIRSRADLKPGATLTVSLDDGKDPVLLHSKPGVSRLEGVRRLKAGPHTVRLRATGDAKIEHLVVRAIPETQYAFYKSQPHIGAFGPYDWDLLSGDVLPNITTMISAGAPEAGILEAWKAAGRQWITISPLVRPGEDEKAVDRAYGYWAGKPGLRHPLMDGIIVDEFGGGDDPVYDVYRRAVIRMKANAQFAGRAYYPYVVGHFMEAERSRAFGEACIATGGLIGYERYLIEQPNEAAARSFIGSGLAGSMRAWERHRPGIARHTLIVLGLLCAPTESLNVHPGTNFKVYMDMQMHHLATHPAFFGLGGVQWYYAAYSNEEKLRWSGRLLRHYCIEGADELLSDDPYELTHIRNPDFAAGTEGWTVTPAEPGNVSVKRHRGYSWLQSRFPRTAVGNVFLTMKRSAQRPNTFSQEIGNLEPGRLYSLKMITADYDDLVQEKSEKKLHAVSIRLDGVEMLDGPKDAFQFPFHNHPRAHTLGKFRGEHRFWMNYHWRVFRAKAATATLTVSDWKGAQEAEGPAGQELMYNFIEIQPYLGR